MASQLGETHSLSILILFICVCVCAHVHGLWMLHTSLEMRMTLGAGSLVSPWVLWIEFRSSKLCSKFFPPWVLSLGTCWLLCAAFSLLFWSGSYLLSDMVSQGTVREALVTLGWWYWAQIFCIRLLTSIKCVAFVCAYIVFEIHHMLSISHKLSKF